MQVGEMFPRKKKFYSLHGMNWKEPAYEKEDNMTKTHIARARTVLDSK